MGPCPCRTPRIRETPSYRTPPPTPTLFGRRTFVREKCFRSATPNRKKARRCHRPFPRGAILSREAPRSPGKVLEKNETAPAGVVSTLCAVRTKTPGILSELSSFRSRPVVALRETLPAQRPWGQGMLENPFSIVAPGTGSAQSDPIFCALLTGSPKGSFPRTDGATGTGREITSLGGTKKALR